MNDARVVYRQDFKLREKQKKLRKGGLGGRTTIMSVEKRGGAYVSCAGGGGLGKRVIGEFKREILEERMIIFSAEQIYR